MNTCKNVVPLDGNALPARQAESPSRTTVHAARLIDELSAAARKWRDEAAEYADSFLRLCIINKADPSEVQEFVELAIKKEFSALKRLGDELLAAAEDNREARAKELSLVVTSVDPDFWLTDLRTANADRLLADLFQS